MKNEKICNVVLERIKYETQVIFESMCSGSMCYLNIDDMWDLIESLTWYQWQCKRGRLLCALPHFPMVYALNLHVQINLGTYIFTVLLTSCFVLLLSNF